jgi:hypothetical protein
MPYRVPANSCFSARINPPALPEAPLEIEFHSISGRRFPFACRWQLPVAKQPMTTAMQTIENKAESDDQPSARFKCRELCCVAGEVL